MKNYPVPLPDRRSIIKDNSTTNTNTNSNKNANRIQINYQQQFGSINLYSNYSPDLIPQSKDPNEDFELLNTMTVIKIKQVEDMRQKLLSMRLLNDKSHYLSSESLNQSINKCNIILFGPSGSGKSSFIKSLYQSLYNNPILPPDPMKKLVVKGHYENEGTLCFTRLHLKEESNDSSGIILCDTRGHIQRNNKEKEQFKVMIEGNIRDDMIIEQRLKRNSFALWEFWKSSNELFPKEIFNAEKAGIEAIPHAIVLVFDGSCDRVISEDDSHFYKELVAISKRKGYGDIHVLLTRVDIFIKLANEQVKHLSHTERVTKLNIMKDEKIENVIDVLDVSRSNIHFIENYHEDFNYYNDSKETRPKVKENNLNIDYHILKTLGELINSCELFIVNYINKSQKCFGDCC